MARYLLSVHTVDRAAPEPMTDEAMQESWKQVGILEREMKATGAWAFSGRLHEADTSTVVRVAGCELLTTDGPFAESKQHRGGSYIIQAADLHAALSR